MPFKKLLVLLLQKAHAFAAWIWQRECVLMENEYTYWSVVLVLFLVLPDHIIMVKELQSHFRSRRSF